MKTKLFMRSMLVAKKGHKLIQWDFSQAETWVVAFYAKSETMKNSLLHGDIHTDTAVGIFESPKEEITKVQRYLGKRANHELSYGASYYMLVQSINQESDKPPFITVSNKEGKDIFYGWHKFHWAVSENYWTFVKEELRANHRVLTNPYGRSIILYNKEGDDLYKEAYAYLPQSTVADHTNGNVQDELGIEGGIDKVKEVFVDKGMFVIGNQSHDSFIAEVENSKVDDVVEPVRNLLERPLVINGEEFTIPVDCEVGERWGEMEEVKREK